MSYATFFVVLLVVYGINLYDCVLIDGNSLHLLHSFSVADLGTFASLIRHEMTTTNENGLNDFYHSLPFSTFELTDEDRHSQISSLFIGLAGGAASRAAKEVILHPIDTIRSRIQADNNSRNTTNKYLCATLYQNLFDGIVPSLLGGVPAGALFFGIKDFTKSFLRDNYVDVFDKRAVTIIAVICANFPYWVIRNPSEVLKTKDQVRGEDGKTKSGLNVKQLYSSYFSNLFYALPADIIKFLAYEYVALRVFHKEAKLESGEAAIAGALASLIAQFVTTPLDVARTRAMLSSDDSAVNPVQRMTQVARQEGWQSLFLGMYPRLVRAVMSGAIQFASYEMTRNALL